MKQLPNCLTRSFEHTLNKENHFKEMSGLVNPASGNKKSFGIQGYKLPKVGLPPKHPVFTIPKDHKQNFLEQAIKRGKQLPGPSQYHKDLPWK